MENILFVEVKFLSLQNVRCMLMCDCVFNVVIALICVYNHIVLCKMCEN